MQEFGVVTTKKEDRIDAALKANYKTKKYGFTGTFGSSGLVRASSMSANVKFKASRQHSQPWPRDQSEGPSASTS